MIPELPKLIIQYGIAGVALLMMYDITRNHLVSIKEILLRIEAILDEKL